MVDIGEVGFGGAGLASFVYEAGGLVDFELDEAIEMGEKVVLEAIRAVAKIACGKT